MFLFIAWCGDSPGEVEAGPLGEAGFARVRGRPLPLVRSAPVLGVGDDSVEYRLPALARHPPLAKSCS